MKIVFVLIGVLSTYQITGMLHYHDLPILTQHQIAMACNATGICMSGYTVF